MPDDLTNRGQPDRNRISLLEPHEVQFWADKFNVSKERLSEAVKNVGHSAVDVESWPRSTAVGEGKSVWSAPYGSERIGTFARPARSISIPKMENDRGS